MVRHVWGRAALDSPLTLVLPLATVQAALQGGGKKTGKGRVLDDGRRMGRRSECAGARSCGSAARRHPHGKACPVTRTAPDRNGGRGIGGHGLTAGASTCQPFCSEGTRTLFVQHCRIEGQFTSSRIRNT